MRPLTAVFVLILGIVFISPDAQAQTASDEPWPEFPTSSRRRSDEESKFIKEMLSKQQSAREKKEYDERLERGQAALELAAKLESSYVNGEELGPEDQKMLVELEKLAKEIRKDLGGDDLDEILKQSDERPKDLRSGFKAVKRTTTKLVDELKKTTRYSVSIVAIESSTALIKTVRALRFWN